MKRFITVILLSLIFSSCATYAIWPVTQRR